MSKKTAAAAVMAVALIAGGVLPAFSGGAVVRAVLQAEALNSGALDVRSSPAVPAPSPALPGGLKGLFMNEEACAVVDNGSAGAPSLTEAVRLLRPCAERLSAKYGTTVSIKKSRAYPGIPGMEKEGLEIEVKWNNGAAALWGPLWQEVEARGRLIFGYRVTLVQSITYN